METEKVIKSTQKQAVAAWIDFLNQCRVDTLLSALASRSFNLKNALTALQQTKIDIATLIASNRGGTTGLHGFIAESAEVGVRNARNLIEGLSSLCEWVNDNGPTDLYIDGIPYQQKFVQDLLGLGSTPQSGVYGHITDYPWFKSQGGKYLIPKDFYEMMITLRNMPKEVAVKLSNSPPDNQKYLTYSAWKKVNSFFEKSGLSTEDIEPSVLNYADVQKGKIAQTLDKEERSIHARDRQLRKEAYEASQPTLAEGLHVTEVSAAIEGGVSFALAIAEKLKTGKSLSQFTAEDWKDVGIDTGVGTIKGGIRGGSVYALTNFTATPAPIASAYVTAIFGMMGQAAQFEQGNIDAEEFIVGTQTVCLEAGISAVSSLLGQATVSSLVGQIIGQTAIPIPILGAVIGNAVGMIAYSIASDYLGKEEQAAIADYIARMDKLNAQLEMRYQKLLAQLKAEFEHFKSLIDFAFDLDANVAFYGSIALADEVGVPKEKTLRTPDDVTRYFTE